MDNWHGFHYGINNVSATKIMKWLHGVVLDGHDWLVLIDYLKHYFIIPDYSDNWFKICLYSSKQVSFFYHKVLDFLSL